MPQNGDAAIGGGKRVDICVGSWRVGITISCVMCVSGSSTVILPCPLDTAYTGPFALTVGLRLSVVISSCMYDVGVPQSHIVITTLRSMPCGRGGAGGSSPAA